MTSTFLQNNYVLTCYSFIRILLECFKLRCTCNKPVHNPVLVNVGLHLSYQPLPLAETFPSFSSAYSFGTAYVHLNLKHSTCYRFPLSTQITFLEPVLYHSHHTCLTCTDLIINISIHATNRLIINPSRYYWRISAVMKTWQVSKFCKFVLETISVKKHYTLLIVVTQCSMTSKKIYTQIM